MRLIVIAALLGLACNQTSISSVADSIGDPRTHCLGISMNAEVLLAGHRCQCIQLPNGWDIRCLEFTRFVDLSKPAKPKPAP